MYETTTGQIVDTLRDTGSVTCFQFSADSKMLAVGGEDSTVRVWDLGAERTPNGVPSLLFRGHTGYVIRVNFHPDCSRLCSAGTDGVVKVWDVANRDRPVTIKGGGGSTQVFAFSAASGRIVVVDPTVDPSRVDGGKDDPPLPSTKSKVGSWDLAGKALGSFAGPLPTFGFGFAKHPIALSGDGKWLAMISFLGTTVHTSRAPNFI